MMNTPEEILEYLCEGLIETLENLTTDDLQVFQTASGTTQYKLELVATHNEES
jgi:hypothetical protein